MTTSARIRSELAARGIPQGALAAVLGLSEQAVSRRMNGTTDWGVSELVAVAGFLGVDAATLLPRVAAAA